MSYKVGDKVTIKHGGINWIAKWAWPDMAKFEAQIAYNEAKFWFGDNAKMPTPKEKPSHIIREDDQNYYIDSAPKLIGKRATIIEVSPKPQSKEMQYTLNIEEYGKICWFSDWQLVSQGE